MQGLEVPPLTRLAQDFRPPLGGLMVMATAAAAIVGLHPGLLLTLVKALVQEVGLSIAAVETLSFGLVQSLLVICDLSLTCLGGTMQHVHGLLTGSLIPFLVLPHPAYPCLEVLYTFSNRSPSSWISSS